MISIQDVCCCIVDPAVGTDQYKLAKSALEEKEKGEAVFVWAIESQDGGIDEVGLF